MNQNAHKIHELLDKKVEQKAPASAVMTGVVRKVDEDKALMDVELTKDEDSNTEGVMINAVSGNLNGILLFPKVGSDCIIAGLDTGGYTLIKATEYDKVKVKVADRTLEVKDGQWTLDGGDNEGLVIVGKAQDNFDTLKDYIKNTLEPAIKAGLIAVGIANQANGTTGANAFSAQVASQQITFEDMENKKVKH